MSARKKDNTRYIFVTGGVVSSLGKGIASASIGRLMIAHDLNVAMLKFDPYINVDPGTMNPYQHGEVYVTDDGAETDLDLGHYERFTGITTSLNCNYTSGRIYDSIETPNGELGFYIISDGSPNPYRIKVRPPCFYLMNTLKFLIEGHMVADIVAILAGLNIIAGELDR